MNVYSCLFVYRVYIRILSLYQNSCVGYNYFFGRLLRKYRNAFQVVSLLIPVSDTHISRLESSYCVGFCAEQYLIRLCSNCAIFSLYVLIRVLIKSCDLPLSGEVSIASKWKFIEEF